MGIGNESGIFPLSSRTSALLSGLFSIDRDVDLLVLLD